MSRSRQRKHKRRVYTMQSKSLFTSMADLKRLAQTNAFSEWFEEMWEAFSECAVVNPVIASMWFHVAHPKATDILKIQATA